VPTENEKKEEAVSDTHLSKTNAKNNQQGNFNFSLLACILAADAIILSYLLSKSIDTNWTTKQLARV